MIEIKTLHSHHLSLPGLELFTDFNQSYCWTQSGRLLASLCRLSVCLSFCLWCCALWLNDTAQQKFLNKWTGSAP